MNWPFVYGLTEVGPGVHAYLQPDGSWGLSNAGLIVGEHESLLVDTLFDLRLTRQMLNEMKPLVAGQPIKTLVNTHPNGDHCYGNQILAGAGVDIVATSSAASELGHAPCRHMGMVTKARNGELEGDLGAFVRSAFGPFDFSEVVVPPVTRTFDGELTLDVSGREVQLIEVGPAHSIGDLIVVVPDAGVVFAGDILFIEGTPVMWAGPSANWIAACELICELAPRAVVPGHGPVTDLDGVAQVADYFRLLREVVGNACASGQDLAAAIEAADTAVDATPAGSWLDRERLPVTVSVMWKEFDPTSTPPTFLEQFTSMGRAHFRNAAG